jgi:hypothetical protein
MYGPVYSATSEQGSVGGVYNRLGILLGDVALNHLYGCITDFCFHHNAPPKRSF